MRRGEGLLLTVVLAVGLVGLLPAAPAAACSCGMPGPVSEATLDEYDVVFTGEVARNQADADMQRRELVVAVDEVWKGEAEATTLVVTHAQQSACGTDPAVGTAALFLMTRGGDSLTRDLVADDELVVMACGGERAATEATALGPGRPPDPAPVPDDDVGVDGKLVAVVAALLVGGVVVGETVRRRRARRETAP